MVTVSGVYARFYDWNSGETRIERFEGRQRGDGASCVAGLSVAPIFSLVERKSNPRITVFAYPSLRQVARCANSQEANGYACCAFVGTEYLLGQTIYPDFRTILWHWRTGERLATTDPGTFAMDPAADLCATFACSSDSPLLMARKLSSDDTAATDLAIFRVLSCCKFVRLFPIETSGISDREPVSVSWTSDGTLLICDRLGNVEAIEVDEDEARRVGTVVRSSGQPARNPVLVAHRDGAMLVVVDESDHRNIRATFFRKATTDRNESWRLSWSILLPSYPSRAESDSRGDRIILLGEGGETMVIIGESRDRDRDRPPRLETLARDDVVDATAIAPLQGSYFATLSDRRRSRLLVVNAATGIVVCPKNRRLSLNHHGEVTHLASHSSLPILATCSDAGNCLVVDASAPCAPKMLGCAHLQTEPLDKLKFSVEGSLLGVGSSKLGRLFLLGPMAIGSMGLKVAAAFNVGRQVVDFLIYSTDSRFSCEAKVLVLVGAEKRHALVGGTIAVFSCPLNGDFREIAGPDHAITTSFLYESLFDEGKSVLAVPYLSNELHRIEFEAEFREATLIDVVPSLHRTRNLGIGLHRRTRDHALLLACGYDGSIVVRENTLRALLVFVAHHRSEGGTRSAMLVGDAIVSLGRNGDLVANRLLEAIIKRGPDLPCSTTPSDSTRGIAHENDSDPAPDRTSKSESESTTTTEEEDCSSETWIERSIRKRNAAEKQQAHSSRLSILEDLNGLSQRIKALLDSNEEETPAARLPTRSFDLDLEARARKLAEAKSTGERLFETGEQLIERCDRTSRYLRERFLEPLRVPPSSIASVLGETKVTNYPLGEVTSRDADLLSWCRFSEATRQAVSRLEAEYESESSNQENPPNQPDLFDSRRGYVQVREASILANDSECDAKIRFNELYEETRSIKQRETKAAIALAEETRRCVIELMRTFHVDATDRVPDISLWHRTVETSLFDGDRIEPVNNENKANKEEGDEIAFDLKDYAFRGSTLERMMDGVLEVGLEEKAKRIVPVPECLANDNDPSSYTSEDLEAIETYENKLRMLRADRLAYRSTLEENIDRATGEFWSRARAFDDRLNALAAEKIRIERSLLLERLTGTWTILWHRRIGRRRREIRLANERSLAPAIKRVRALAAECDLFEAGLIELRNRYETKRRRDKQLEEKFRADFLDSKQPMAAEHLLRHYRKRPRTALTAACGTSPVFLRELADRVLDSTPNQSELLPRDWLAYLRGLRDLDAIPEGGLPFRIEADQWREACGLRRLKVEAEIKMRSCAIELAEAEQSLAFYRRACSNARATQGRRKEAILKLEKAMTELLEDQEVRLVLKTGQLRQQPRGDSTSEWSESVLIPRRELDLVAEAVAAAGQRKLTELRRLVNLQRARSREEWRQACLQRTMQDLRASLVDLTNVKARKLERGGLAEPSSVDADELSSAKLSFRQLEDTVRKERSRSQRISDESRSWRRRNAKLKHRVQESEAETNRLTVAARDPFRLQAVAFRERRMRAVTTKAKLARTIRSNFEELLVLESRLEISKLRTYPTLRLKM
ncbi:cilia- and flagella-associated protein 43 [Megalopta genalis]|uniref:cilia- and flagella-associated protein 43 n=1 Tax=Megalopta genalis TaxID=115081 RepID=UPI003FD6059A